jgi:hypothetical protein
MPVRDDVFIAPITSCLLVCQRILALGPDGRSPFEENPWDRQHEQREEAEERRRPTDAQCFVHYIGSA